MIIDVHMWIETIYSFNGISGFRIKKNFTLKYRPEFYWFLIFYAGIIQAQDRSDWSTKEVDLVIKQDAKLMQTETVDDGI